MAIEFSSEGSARENDILILVGREIDLKADRRLTQFPNVFPVAIEEPLTNEVPFFSELNKVLFDVFSELTPLLNEKGTDVVAIDFSACIERPFGIRRVSRRMGEAVGYAASKLKFSSGAPDARGFGAMPQRVKVIGNANAVSFSEGLFLGEAEAFVEQSGTGDFIWNATVGTADEIVFQRIAMKDKRGRCYSGRCYKGNGPTVVFNGFPGTEAILLGALYAVGMSKLPVTLCVFHRDESAFNPWHPLDDLNNPALTVSVAVTNEIEADIFGGAGAVLTANEVLARYTESAFRKGDVSCLILPGSVGRKAETGIYGKLSQMLSEYSEPAMHIVLPMSGGIKPLYHIARDAAKRGGQK